MRRLKAFTLIELLVVVAIIGILIAILIPSLSRAKERTRQVTCATNLHGYGIALQSYLVDYRGPMTTLVNPFGGATPAAFWVYENNGGQISLEGLSPYLKGVTGLDPNRTDVSQINITKIWFCPSQGMGQPSTSPDTPTWHWFTMNYSYLTGFDSNPLRGMATTPNDLGDLANLPGRIVMEDAFFRWANPPSGGPRWDINHAPGGAVAQHLNGPFVTGTPNFLGNNVLMSDSSVRFKEASEYAKQAKLLDTSPSTVTHVNGGGGDQTFY